MENYIYVKGHTVSDFNSWLENITTHYGSAAEAKLNWKSDFGMTPKDFVRNLWLGAPLFPPSQKPFCLLAEFVNDDGSLREGVTVSQKNLTVINHLAKSHCMVDCASHGSGFWETVAYCWGFNSGDGINLFLSAFADLASFHNLDDNLLIKALFLDEANRNILIFAHLTKRLQITMYCYNLVCAKFCLMHYEKEGYNINDIWKGIVDTPIMPGTALLTQYLHDYSAHEVSKPFVVIGQYGNHLLPFVAHSHDKNFNIFRLITKKSTYINGKLGPQDIVEQNWIRMSSRFITATKPYSEDIDMGMAFGKCARLPEFKAVTFDQMKVVELNRTYKATITCYGVGGFRTQNFEAVRPVTKLTTAARYTTLTFDSHDIKKLERCDGIYNVEQRRVQKDMTIDEAKARAIYKFGKLTVDDRISSFLVIAKSPATARKLSEPNMKSYLSLTQTKCHLISNWSNPAEFLVSETTSSLQAINVKKSDGIHAPKYTTSVGNSFMKVQTGYRGLNKAVYLLTGTKNWFVVPQADYPKFRMWLEQTITTNEDNHCKNWLLHDGLFIDPTAVPDDFNLSFICQTAGDLLVLDNYSFYWGWNEDFNISYEWYFSGDGWDNVQHLEPLCECDRCSNNLFTINDLTAMRQKDKIINQSSIPTVHVDDPTFNPFQSGWKPTFKDHQPISNTYLHSLKDAEMEDK